MSVAIVIVHKNIWKLFKFILIKSICTVLIKMVHFILVLCISLSKQSLNMVSHFSIKGNTCKLTNSKPLDSKTKNIYSGYIYLL